MWSEDNANCMEDGEEVSRSFADLLEAALSCGGDGGVCAFIMVVDLIRYGGCGFSA